MKPHLRVVGDQLVEASRTDSKLEAARRRHGKPFAHDPKSTWKPRSQPVLIEWLASRKKEEA